jgi:hypothetical protein
MLRALKVRDRLVQVLAGSDGGFEAHREVRIRRRERMWNAPRALPARRPRRLTFSQHESATAERGTLPQSHQSPLFRLPPELRRLIWESIISDGNVIHIARLRKRMRGIRCRGGDPHEREHTCWGSGSIEFPGVYSQRCVRDIPGRQGRDGGMGDVLNLMTTCRKM